MRIAILGLVLVPAIAFADRRSFTNTYEYATLPEGDTEVELWHTESRDTWGQATAERFEERFELEHGITDNWDAALYTVFTEVAARDPAIAAPLGLDSVRLETRYRFADRGQWPVDAAAYFAAAKDFGRSLYELEGRAIVARDFDRMTAAANLYGDVELGRDAPSSQLAMGWAGGVAYEVTTKLKLGGETWGSYQDHTTRATAGPVLSVAPTPKLWLALTAGFAITSTADAFVARVMIGLAP